MSERVLGLDILRAVAIMLVLISHSSSFLIGTIPARYTDCIFWSFGVSGVEIFFVLSGFLIGNILMKNIDSKEKFTSKQLFNFWIRRWFRTLPLFYLALSIKIISTDSLTSAPFQSLIQYFFIQSLFDNTNHLIEVSWTLCIEELFYIFFPLSIFITNSITNTPLRKIFIRVISFTIIGCLVLKLWTIYQYSSPMNWAEWDNQIRRPVTLRFDSIMFGILGAYYYQKYPSLWIKYAKPLLFIGLITFACSAYLHLFYAIFGERNLLIQAIVLPMMNVSILLCLPFFSLWKTQKGIFSTVIYRLSLYSYSIYLVHPFLIDWFNQNKLSGVTIFSATIVMSILTSALTYHFFERPCTNLRNKWDEQN